MGLETGQVKLVRPEPGRLQITDTNTTVTDVANALTYLLARAKSADETMLPAEYDGVVAHIGRVQDMLKQLRNTALYAKRKNAPKRRRASIKEFQQQ